MTVSIAAGPVPPHDGPSPSAKRSRSSPPATQRPQHMLLPAFVNSHHHVGVTPLQLGSRDHALELWFTCRMSARDVQRIGYRGSIGCEYKPAGRTEADLGWQEQARRFLN